MFFTIGNLGTIRSVSIILYSPNYGFLISDEIRLNYKVSKDKILENHLIGGKVESYDISPIHTGFREFCEELNFKKENLSTDETVNYLVSNMQTCDKRKWDFCVSEKKKLYHRFYCINIDTISNRTLYHELFLFLLKWKEEESLSVKKIYFWKKGDRLISPSSLLTTFIRNIHENF